MAAFDIYEINTLHLYMDVVNAQQKAYHAGKPSRETRMTAITAGYQSGFGNEFATEALPGALPAHRNSPQRAPYGLYAEQISGTAFTAPRSHNRRSWLYRIRPAAMHAPFVRIDNGLIAASFDEQETPPNQLRWEPQPMPVEPTDFVAGLMTVAGNGSPDAQSGCAIHLYAANCSMTERFFILLPGNF